MKIRDRLFSLKIWQNDLLLLLGLALFVRLLAAWPQQQPNYMDAAYSYVNALNLLAGRGFVEDFVWNYLGQPGRPPQPSHLYWMPLTSMLAWLGMLIGGASYRAAQIPFIILSALLAPLTYWLTYLLSNQRRLGWLAGLLAIFSGFYFPVWTAIDNFTPFAIAGSMALLAAWYGLKRSGEPTNQRASESANSGWRMADGGWQQAAWLVASGIFVGLAHLTRADGSLLLITILLIACQVSEPKAPYGRVKYQVSRVKYQVSRFTFYILRFTFFLLLGYLLVMTPWFIRNWAVVGTPLPAAGSQTIWLADYDQLFSYGRDLSARSFWAQGLGPILRGRWWAFTTNLQTVIAVWGMIFLGPLAVVGGWRNRHHLLLQLAGLYALLLFIAMTLAFAFPGARGGLFHSGAALLPFIQAAAVVGLEHAIDWVAARRRRWDAPLAKQFFGVGLLLMAVILSCFLYYGRVLRGNGWNGADQLYPTIATWVAQQNPAAVVMIGNPPAYRYHGGGLSVIVPAENLETTLAVAHRYGVDYLILDHNRPALLADVYDSPATQPGLALVQTYQDETGYPVYIFKVTHPGEF